MGELEVSLPTEVVASTVRNPKLMIIYSPPKTGKTTLLSKLEGNLIIDLEKGTKYLDALKMEIDSLDQLQSTGAAIVKAGKPYKYVTIDTITKLEEMCLGVAKQMYMGTPMGKNFDGNSILELPQGAGYFWLRQAFTMWLGKIKKLADHIILVGHIKDKYIEKKGKEVMAKDLDLTGKLKQIVTSDADAIGYLYRDAENSLVLNFKSSDEITCGARPAHLKGREITMAKYDEETNDVTDVAWNEVFID
tara:strand:+ start:311 stop:1054 length:744 start_codon:yes stop_codon:yes gene_type:complete